MIINLIAMFFAKLLHVFWIIIAIFLRPFIPFISIKMFFKTHIFFIRKQHFFMFFNQLDYFFILFAIFYHIILNRFFKDNSPFYINFIIIYLFRIIAKVMTL